MKSPRRVIPAILLTAALSTGCVAETTTKDDVLGPVIRASGTSHQLVLPAAHRKAIGRAVPGFEPWKLETYSADIRQMYDFTGRQVPWAVVGDFDGDGSLDAVVDGSGRDTCYRLCVWSRRTGPVVTIVDTLACQSATRPGYTVLMYVAPGRHGTNFDEQSTFIPHDGFFDYIFEKAGSIWYWKDGSWQEFYAAD